MRKANAARALALGPLAAVLMLTTSGRAQAPTSGGDKVAAEALFEDGRKLVAAGKYPEACPKFADSERLDPSPSTLLNLANCWEKLGRTATAWATYKEAESAANAAKRQEYVDTARRHAEALAPKLAHLTVSVAQPPGGLQVSRDGAAVGPSQWGAAIPIDAGQHSLEASAPGFKAWTGKVDVPRDGVDVAVTVPALEPLPPEAPTAAPQPSLSPATPASTPPAATATPGQGDASVAHGGGHSVVGLVVGSLGVVGLGVSGALALAANSKKQDSMNNCGSKVPGATSSNDCNATGVAARNDALSFGNAATAVFAVGAVALAGGIVLWIALPGGGTESKQAVMVAPTPGGAIVKGSW